MRLKALEEKYFVNADVTEVQARIEKALDELGLKNVRVKKHVPPRYMLVEYSPSWVGKALEIEFLFQETQGGTEVAVKWPYMKELPGKDEPQTEFQKHQQEMWLKTEKLISDFKRKIGATATPQS